MLRKLINTIKTVTTELVVGVFKNLLETLNAAINGIRRMPILLRDAISNIYQIARKDFLLLLLFIGSCFVLGFAATKISTYSLDSTLPGSFIVLTILSKPFFESIIRLYNYSKDEKKKLSGHAIAFFDFLKIFAVNSVLIIFVQRVTGTTYQSDLEAVAGMGAIGFLTLAVTLASYSLLMALAEKRFISEEDLSEQDEKESKLIRSYRSLSNEQKSEIQELIDKRLDK